MINAAAVIDDDGTLTMQEVYERASMVAALLRERKCDNGTICIYMERSAPCCWVAIGALMVRARRCVCVQQKWLPDRLYEGGSMEGRHQRDG